MGDSPLHLLWFSLQSSEVLFPAVAAFLLAVVFARPLGSVACLFREFSLHFSRRPILTAALILATVFGLRVVLLPWLPVPAPAVHDEFSHLLLADTLSHGRLTNPTPAMWMHFETFHVNLRPTYQSMYLPGQAIFLAAGQMVTGSPYSGVVLSVALMCIAFWWALRGWLPGRWALLGTLLAILRFSATDYWMNSYWGGAVAATGGALVLGAYPRVIRRVRSMDSVLFGVGLLLLANTRAYEGLLFSLAFLCAVAAYLVSRLRRDDVPYRSLVMPLSFVLVVGFGLMMFYNWRGTASPLRMPYTVNLQQYHPTGPFVWQSLRTVQYDHPRMAEFYRTWEMPAYERTRTVAGILREGVKSAAFDGAYYLRWLLLPFVAGVVFCVRNRKFRIILGGVALMAAGMMLETWDRPAHYAAPATCALFLIVLLGLRWVAATLRSRENLGRRLALAYTLLFVILLTSLQVSLIGQLGSPAVRQNLWNYRRQEIVREFEQKPGRHLILVRYGAIPVGHIEWVYNGSDLEDGKVLWARYLGPDRDRELIAHYNDRHIWVLDADRFRATPVEVDRRSELPLQLKESVDQALSK